MDGDGVPNTSDAFPNDPAASKDSDEDGHPDEWNTGKNQTDSTTGLKLDAYPNDPTKWEGEEEKSNEKESFLSQKIGLFPLYALVAVLIIGLAAGAGALKMKGGKPSGEAQKPEQSQQPTSTTAITETIPTTEESNDPDPAGREGEDSVLPDD